MTDLTTRIEAAQADEARGLHIPADWRPSLLEAFCSDKCAEFGDPPCSAVEPDDGYCPDCIDDCDRAIALINMCAALKAKGL